MSPAALPARDFDRALVWFRRDLRAHDNAALYHALRSARRVWCVFVLDTAILEPLREAGRAADRRVEFILGSLGELDLALRRLGGGGLIVKHGASVHEVSALARRLGVQAVFTNHDDEPDALARDAKALGALADAGIALRTHKDHVIFERNEVLTGAGTPYGVFTPYKNAWLKKAADEFYLEPYPVERHAAALAPWPEGERSGIPSLADIGFRETNLRQLLAPGVSGARALLDDFLHRIDEYGDTRDFPAVKGPSYLSVHLRFGTVSIRELAGLAKARADAGSRGAATWLSELVWRDFYHQILHHHPHVVTRSFRPEYDAVKWEHGAHAERLFEAWCEGRTGYPLVDAAMRQLAQSGYMHNRLRMVTASFLTKDLGIDWRRGERFFALHLNDYDLAANNGGWQWAASTGCDAQPWFRIFNPVAQSEKFDAKGRFIRRYVPELAALPDAAIHAPWLARPVDLEAAGLVLGRDYPRPVVDHAEARERTLARFGVLKDKEKAGRR